MNRNGPVALGFHAAFTVFMIAPLAIVCLVAFTPSNLLSVPTIHFSMRWFKAIVDDPDFTQAFANSLWLATLSATLAAMLAVPAALGLIRYRFAGRDAINSLLLSPLMIPPVVLGVALLQLFTRIGVSGSFVSLVLAHVMLVFPYCLRLIMASLVATTRDAEHAAISLGANAWTTFRRITLPALPPVGCWVSQAASTS
jgi:putative spermidine/putrescine transport system permease protein